MFDLGWGELLVVGAVALVVLGPKELPNALRTITNLTKSARRLAGEFQSGINEIVREAELEDARKVVVAGPPQVRLGHHPAAPVARVALLDGQHQPVGEAVHPAEHPSRQRLGDGAPS